jgi:hypothetical protein
MPRPYAKKTKLLAILANESGVILMALHLKIE